MKLFSEWVGPLATWKMVPSRRYRKMAEQEGFAHFDTIAASIALCPAQEQFARENAIGLRSRELPYYAISEVEVIPSTFRGEARHPDDKLRMTVASADPKRANLL